MDPPHFYGDPTADAQDFFDMCYEILRNLALVDSNGVYFDTFHLRGTTKRWWHTYDQDRPIRSLSLS